MRTSSVPNNSNSNNNSEQQILDNPIQKSSTTEPKKILQKSKYIEKTNSQGE